MQPTLRSMLTKREPVRLARRVTRHRRALSAVAAVGAVSVLAAACGGGGDGTATAGQRTGIAVTAPDEVIEATAEVLATRPGEGITAAGGTVAAGTPCPEVGSPGAAPRVTIAGVTPDLDRLGDIGLGNLVLDDWQNIFEAYIDQVNGFGGIGGHCFDFSYFTYGFTNVAEEVGAICAGLPQEQPLVLFGLAFNSSIAQCSTVAAQIPTIGLYSQFSEAFFAQAGDQMIVDHGSYEFLLDNGVRTGANAGVLAATDSIGLLYSDDDTAQSIQTTFSRATDEAGLQVVASAGVPSDLQGTAVVLVEEQFHEAGGELFHPDGAVFANAVQALPPEFGGLLAGVRQYFIDTATAMRDAGVTTVVGTASWSSVRNLMRAAELIGWYPQWMINDAQFALIVLTDAPAAQGANLVQVSSKRAAGDPIDGLDRGCLSLRNTGSTAEPFSHRFHTDAWNLLTVTCDYLDIVFGAISRVEGELTRESFRAALRETSYRSAHGTLVTFGAADIYGSDNFRVLGADPTCVLNEWGCMRPLTGWLEPAAHAAASGTGTAVEG